MVYDWFVTRPETYISPKLFLNKTLGIYLCIKKEADSG